MNYALTSEAGTVVATLDGKIDYASVGTLDDVIRDIGEINPAVIVFDMARVSSMDSVGLGLLLSLHETFAGKAIKLRNVQPRVSHLLDITAAKTLFEVTE